MLPVTRANLDHICCICLLDIRPSVFTQKVYDVKEEKKLSKLLKLTAHITVLRNPINQKYINDYCRKVCEICLLKTQYSFYFREKIISSVATLKDLLEKGIINGEDIKKLQYFCRVCLNRQKTCPEQNASMTYLKWLKNCSGVRFTSLDEPEMFRIKEGTNINEIIVVNDEKFPKQLCQTCLKKLRNVEEFRRLATQSFEYMFSVMGDVSIPEEDFVKEEIKQFKENIVWHKVPQAQRFSVEDNSSKIKNAILQNDMNNDDYIENSETSFISSETPKVVLIRYDSETMQFNESVYWSENSREILELIMENGAKDESPSYQTINTVNNDIEYAQNVSNPCSTENTENVMLDFDNNYDLINSIICSHTNSALQLTDADIDYEMDDIEDYTDDEPEFTESNSDTSDYNEQSKCLEICSLTGRSNQVRDLYMAWPDFFYPPPDF